MKIKIPQQTTIYKEIEFSIGQLFKWGEMYEDEFGRQSFTSWIFRVVDESPDHITVNIGKDLTSPTTRRNFSTMQLQEEIEKGRMFNIAQSQEDEPVTKNVSRLEKVDD